MAFKKIEIRCSHTILKNGKSRKCGGFVGEFTGDPEKVAILRFGEKYKHYCNKCKTLYEISRGVHGELTVTGNPKESSEASPTTLD